MKIVKSESPGQFFIVGMDVAKDQRLSLTERGMLLTLLSLPPDWDFTVEGMARAQGIDERLKASDQMQWVRMMNNIRVCAEESVLKELIYS